VSVNKYKPHVWVIPEDDADRQLVNGFVLQHSVDDRQIGINPPAGGWGRVLDVFEQEFVQYLRNFKAGHVLMLIDFDERGEDRRSRCEERIPDDLKSRVFLIGTSDTPEDLRQALGLSLEEIGTALADDCVRDVPGHWEHPHLAHNIPELRRMTPLVRPILFRGV
jgi:hypothetical protein